MAEYQGKYNKYVKLKKYTFFSDGNSYDFNPAKTVNYAGKLTTMLDVHLHEAAHRNSKSVFILDETGIVVKH
jgi:hypothetical protein